MFRSAILLFCLLTIPVRANLGETVEQCVARYGHPVAFTEASAKVPFGTVAFTANDYMLIVFVIKNEEVGARVSKTDKSAFTDTERQNIMNADSLAASSWAPATSTDPTCLRWTRSDKATVLYDKDKHILIFTSDEMATAMHAAPSAPTTALVPTTEPGAAPEPVIPPRSMQVAPAPPTPWSTFNSTNAAPSATNAAPPAP